MLAETTILLSVLTTILGVGTPLLVKGLKDINKAVDGRVNKLAEKHEADCDELTDKFDKIKESQIVVETKLDIFLQHEGFDVPKVNKAIKEHMDELKENGKPSVGGCINITELYLDKEAKDG
jgi:hypothetical protein